MGFFQNRAFKKRASRLISNMLILCPLAHECGFNYNKAGPLLASVGWQRLTSEYSLTGQTFNAYPFAIYSIAKELEKTKDHIKTLIFFSILAESIPDALAACMESRLIAEGLGQPTGEQSLNEKLVMASSVIFEKSRESFASTQDSTIHLLLRENISRERYEVLFEADL